VQGHSLASVLRGEILESEPETAFLCMMPGMPKLVEEYRKLGLNSNAFGWRGIKTKTHTYIIDNGTSPGEEQMRYLYDNVSDPFQLHPLTLSKESSLCAEYDLILEEYLRQTKDPFLMNV